jgi:hypothetical protein
MVGLCSVPVSLFSLHPSLFLSSPGGTRTPDPLLVRELPSPLGHRTVVEWTHPDSHRDLWHATPASSCSRDEPSLRSGSRETRTHKRLFVATCFQDRLLIQPDDFRPLSCGSWNRTNGLLVQSQASLPTATVPQCLHSSFVQRHARSCMVR